MPIVAASDLLFLPENLGHFYFSTICDSWSGEFHFQMRVVGRQEGVSRWLNVKLYSVRVLNHPKYYCKVPVWWTQYEDLVLLFTTMALIMFYCSILALCCSVNYKTAVWKIALTEHVFMDGTMFVLNAGDGACTRYYTLANLFDALSRGVLSRLSDKNIGRAQVLRHVQVLRFV